ncbi:MAG TPA: ATP-binding protein [bacterium]|nr:ATP-binding protein [bacterium]
MRLTLQIKLLLIVILGVFVPMELCVIYVLHQNRENLKEVFVRQGRVMFNQILITRRWLSLHGGVYVIKYPFVKTSPFIENADTSTLQGVPITLRTPDLVTREISMLSGQENASHFRIVSLLPINPANRPDPWEAQSLASFEQKAPEAWTMSGQGPATRFRYIAPIFTEASCLKCHQELGHRVGDVRGAISLDFPVGGLIIQAEKDSRDFGLIATGLGLSAMFLLWLAARRFVLTPVSRVAAAVAAMGKGDYETPLGRVARDELGDLAETVIEMRGLIRDYGKNLEGQVAARTKELLEINQSLEAKVKQQTAALLEQEKLAALGEVSAGLAHEIRNPLSAILSGISLLESGKRTEAERSHIIKLIRREAGRLNTSLTDFLLFARPQQPTMVRIDLNGIIREIVHLIEDDPEIKGEADVRLELANLPPIWFDDDQLRQMIWNIVLNALQAMDGRGLLNIRTVREGETWRLEVSDTGPGIPDEIRGRVYDPFFSTKRDGTGLGLSIVRRIVAAHHGTISFDCTPGNGCTFIITAPLAAGEQNAAT